jgi:hypothetical protein
LELSGLCDCITLTIRLVLLKDIGIKAKVRYADISAFKKCDKPHNAVFCKRNDVSGYSANFFYLQMINEIKESGVPAKK